MHWILVLVHFFWSISVRKVIGQGKGSPGTIKKTVVKHEAEVGDPGVYPQPLRYWHSLPVNLSPKDSRHSEGVAHLVINSLSLQIFKGLGFGVDSLDAAMLGG